MGSGSTLVAGAILSTQLNANPRDDADSIGAIADGALEGDGEVTLTVSGKLDVLGYSVTAEGKVSALRCKKK